MKHKLSMLFSGALMLIIITLSSGCVVATSSRGSGHPNHKRRHVWVNEVYYEQVYYVDNLHNTIIVSQKEVPHKKKHHNNGRGKKH